MEEKAVAAVAAARHLQVLGIDLEQLRRRRERRARLAAADGRHLARSERHVPQMQDRDERAPERRLVCRQEGGGGGEVEVDVDVEVVVVMAVAARRAW